MNTTVIHRIEIDPRFITIRRLSVLVRVQLDANVTSNEANVRLSIREEEERDGGWREEGMREGRGGEGRRVLLFGLAG